MSYHAHFVESFCYKRMLNSVKIFLYINWNDCKIFILHFVLMQYHVDWFVDIESFLHSRTKYYLIMVIYDPFNILLNSAFDYLVEDFCIYVHQEY